MMEAWITIGIVLVMLLTLTFTRLAADVVLIAALTLLLVVPTQRDGNWKIGVLSVQEAISGFSNPGPLTVGILFVVAAGLVQTGAVEVLVHSLLGRPKSLVHAQVRMMLPVVGVSAFLNNTAVVAMMIPAIRDWAKKLGISPSKLMLPLSYAAILGGSCTLIGTSTNLVVNGLAMARGMPSMGMFDITWVGVPCAVVGAAYLILIGRRLLPDRQAVMSRLKDPREYTVEMTVDPDSAMVGQSIENAGLRHLPGLYLLEIQRGSEVLAAVGPHQQLQANDRLVFVGIVESVKDLQRIRGLTPATNQVFKLEAPRHERTLIEAVVSNTCSLVGKTIREGRFRTRYNAAVIAVARNAERVRSKIGAIELRAGDTLLLEAHPSFVEQQKNSRDFFLVSTVADSKPPRHERAWISLLVLVSMVAVVAAGWVDMLVAALLAACLMLLTRCCSVGIARQSIEWPVLLVIAAALGVGTALETSGAARVFVETLTSFTDGRPWLALAVIYGITMITTELITNNAAAALMFPFAITIAKELAVDPRPLIITVMMAASASFSTPLGYQTNLMVCGPGGYRFGDYLRVGIPMNLLMWGTTVAITPLVFPFQ